MTSATGGPPAEARVAIVGGGMAGCSLAHHCARLGCTDVVLLERDQLTSGATWHAAGLCTQFNWDPGITEILLRSTAVYRDLEDAAASGIGWRPVGSLRLAAEPAQLAEFEAVLERGRGQGLQGTLLDRDATQALWPWLEADGVVGSAHIPGEGYVDPARAAGALAAAAREAGVRVWTGVEAQGVTAAPDGRWRVATERGTVTAETVVMAAGAWSGGLASQLGLRLPVVGMEHQHGLTAAVAELGRSATELPVLRDPQASFYIRQDQAGFLCGPFEDDPVTVGESEIAHSGPFQLRRPDPERLARGLAAACRRIPVLDRAGIRSVVAGVDGYTPDGLPLVGELPQAPGVVWCTAFSLFGIAFGAGVGALLAERLVGGIEPPVLAALAADRFGRDLPADVELAARARRTYAAEYRPPAGRPVGRRAGTAVVRAGDDDTG